MRFKLSVISLIDVSLENFTGSYIFILNFNSSNLSIYTGTAGMLNFFINCAGIVVSEFEFPDHYKYTKKDIDKILDQAKDLNCKIITTEKDFESLKNLKTGNIKYIKSELKIFDEEKFIKSVI